VRLLIERGANVNLSHSGTKTALMMSIEKQYDNITKLLLENGADKYAVRNNTSPFFLAVKLNDFPAMYLLLHSGENNINYMQSVYTAAKNADAQLFVYLIEREIPEISSEHITFPITAIDKGERYLLTEQDADGIYEHFKNKNINTSNGGRRKLRKSKKTRKNRKLY
jgi:ankyrin repeat protein